MEHSGHIDAVARLLRQWIVVLAIAAMAFSIVTASASASSQFPITIETSKPFGPVTGTFTASGAFTDSGTIDNLSRTASGFGAPTFLGSHLTILFTGDNGTFTIKAQIVETVTADPLVLTNTGTWTLIAGTGAYEDLRGIGTISGTADHNIDLITRTYEGSVHFD
jgi:hypothetical protein